MPTPVEAAAVTALYAFVSETLVYRDLNLWKDVPRVMTECGLLIGGVLLILGVALQYVDFRYPHDWRSSAPKLKTWHAAIAARPSFTKTQPPDFTPPTA